MISFSAWLVGLVLSLAVMGPALGPGSLLNLDLVMVPDPPVPRGVWALGPELPRRVPMWVPVAWLSSLVGGDVVARALLVGGLVVAFAGMYRLVVRITGPGARRSSRWSLAWAPLAAAVLYAFGPFMITRLAVGHLMIVWTMAVLPWALPDLLDPGRSPRRVLLWCAAMGFTGVYGGAIAAVVVAVGLIATRGRRLVAVSAAFLVGQLPWLVPLAVVGASRSAIADATGFETPLSGVAGVGRLLAGHGFWNPPFQVGGPGGWGVALIGFALLGLAAVGTAELPARWRLPLVGLAAIGLFVSAASGVPGLDGLVARLSRTPLGAPFRETQRLLPLYLVWMAPAAALGAAKLGRGWRRAASPAVATAGRVAPAVPLALGLVLLGPGLWGAGGQLRPVQYPAEWARARAAVRAAPGPVVALPWHQYFTFDIADNRLVLNTVPLYFGGDVIISSDPKVGEASDGSAQTQERGDRREATVAALLDEAKVKGPDDDPCGIRGAKVEPGRPIGADLARLGVRYVVMMKDVDWLCYLPSLGFDPDLESIVSGPSLELYRVKGWQGDVVTDDGHSVPADSTISPWWQVDASGSARMDLPAASGWLRGTTPVGVTDDGILQLPAGSGPVWYWPSVVTVVADLVWLAALVWAAIGVRREHREARARAATAPAANALRGARPQPESEQRSPSRVGGADTDPAPGDRTF